MSKKSVLKRALSTALAAAMAALAFPGPAAAIIGGTPAPFPQYSYVVLVHTPGGDCTGIVVATGQVLTAAHCVAGRAPGDVRILVPDQLTPAIPALYVYSHPLWNGDVADGHDLAVIVAAQDVQSVLPQYHIDPVQVGSPWDATPYAAGTEATIVGAGRTVAADPQSAGDVYAATTAISSDSAMEARYGEDHFRRSIMIGAGGLGHTTCNGDSGGPLLVSNAGRTMAVGLDSFHQGNCDRATAFTELSGPILAWVASIVPTIMNNWPVCLDRYGLPGIATASYQYQPWDPNDGTYYGTISCLIRPTDPPPADPPPAARFTGTGNGAKPPAALTRATTIANNRAHAAGYTDCGVEDSTVEPDEEVGGYRATVTVACFS